MIYVPVSSFRQFRAFSSRPVHLLSAVFLASAFPGWLIAAEQILDWRIPTAQHVTLAVEKNGVARITSARERAEFTVESVQTFPAKTGDSFEVNVRIKADPSTRAYPELVCYDEAGRELPVQSPLGRENPYVTTEWQTFRRVYVVRPGTASARVRLRGWAGAGKGALHVTGLEFRPKAVDPYETGALITQPHAYRRQGIVLESNFGIANRDLISSADRDGDGKWALITVNLDELTAPANKREDWRSGFEDNPNVILWSDGAVLKSDTVHADRAPDRNKALHYRMQIHPGPYGARISDAGRAVAVSLDGQTWKRHEAGREINLGTLAMSDGVIEFWMDACYRDSVSAGPAYFDYVRLSPAIHAPSIDRLYAAARGKPPRVSRGAAEERRVPVTVSTPVLPRGSAWPVRCGLPIPRGELLSAEKVTVLDSAGTKIPSQNRVTATWPDGSARWIFIDMMHRATSDPDNGAYTVVYGNRVRAATGPNTVKTTRTASGIEVDTGAIRFFVSGSSFRILENVRLSSGQSVQAEPIAAEIVEASGRTWRASELSVERIEIEQPGPLHTVIVVETKLAESGKPSTGFYHRARIHAYADSPLIEIDYFVANTDSRPAGRVGGSMSSKVAVKSISLRVKPDRAITGAQHALGPAGATGAIVQQSADDAITQQDAAATELRAGIPGWLTLHGDLGPRPSPAALSVANGSGHSPPSDILHVGVTDFREQFPKAMRWSTDEVKIDLWAEEGGNYEWIEGVGKTHHIVLHYGPAVSDGAEVLSRLPLLAVAAPEWYARSGAMGEIDIASPEVLPEVEKTLVRHMKESVIGRVGLGFENYGDHSSGGYIKGTYLWDNNEYDLPAACMVHFARTGDRDALQIGLASALHYLDVDTIHYSSKHADWARAAHVHSHASFGHHTAEGPNFHHAGYVRGLIWHSYFTGDPIGINGAQGIADWCLRNLGVHTNRHERYLGHPLMTLNDVYDATGDERYLRGSAHLAEQALKWEYRPRSGFPAPKAESPAYYSGNPFNAGVTSSALMQFNDWAKLPEIDAMLQRVAQWLLTDVWRPPGGLQAKGGSPRQLGSPHHIANHGRLMALAYRQTKDPLFLVVPQTLTVAGYGEGAGNPIGTRGTGLVYNYLPWFLATLKSEGNPQPEPEFEFEARAETTIAPGDMSQIVFKVRNGGVTPITELRASFKTRLDFRVTEATPVPTVLHPGEAVELRYEVQAPEQINLTCEYNHTAFGHWSALYRRANGAHIAHWPVKIVLTPAQMVEYRKSQ